MGGECCGVVLVGFCCDGDVGSCGNYASVISLWCWADAVFFI